MLDLEFRTVDSKKAADQNSEFAINAVIIYLTLSSMRDHIY
jgi:hypothetical protein